MQKPDYKLIADILRDHINIFSMARSEGHGIGGTYTDEAVLHQAALLEAQEGETVTGSMVDALVNAFLCWPLPQDFAPDCGISFNPGPTQHMPHCWPVGTNLLTAAQAKAMFAYLLARRPRGTYATEEEGDAFTHGWFEGNESLPYAKAPEPAGLGGVDNSPNPLAPCPFCGSAAREVPIHTEEMQHLHPAFDIECSNDACDVQPRAGTQEGWNRRATPPPPAQDSPTEAVAWRNGCQRTVPAALRYLAVNPRPENGEQPFNYEHLLQLADEIEYAYTHAAPAGVALPADQQRKLQPTHRELRTAEEIQAAFDAGERVEYLVDGTWFTAGSHASASTRTDNLRAGCRYRVVVGDGREGGG